MHFRPFLKVTRLKVHVFYRSRCVVCYQSKVIPCLLRLRNSHNAAVAENAREALALVGYIDAISGRGIRVLCLDGGGTKYVPDATYQFQFPIGVGSLRRPKA